MTNGGSPEEWFVSGEPATKGEIAIMEGLASDLLADVPAEYSRQYGYAIELGPIALFSTLVREDEYQLGSFASVAVAQGHPDNVKMAITIGYDNKRSNIFFDSDEELDAVPAIIQDLIELDLIDPADAKILRHMQAVVFCMMNGIDVDHIEILPDADPNKDFQLLGDVIRSQVDVNTSSAVRTKFWGVPVDNDHIVTVSTNEIVGELSENDDLLPLPKLQVEYEDRCQGIKYIFSRLRDGRAKLDAMNGIPEEDEEPLTDDDIEEEVAAFIEELEIDTPGKSDVRLITRMLSRAIKNVPIPSPSN